SPARHRTHRGPHHQLLPLQGHRRPHQQLGRPLRHAQKTQGSVQRSHARPHHVRPSLLHGPHRLAHVTDRCPAHRLRLRRRQHAHHGPHWPPRLRRNRQGR